MPLCHLLDVDVKERSRALFDRKSLPRLKTPSSDQPGLGSLVVPFAMTNDNTTATRMKSAISCQSWLSEHRTSPPTLVYTHAVVQGIPVYELHLISFVFAFWELHQARQKQHALST